MNALWCEDDYVLLNSDTNHLNEVPYSSKSSKIARHPDVTIHQHFSIIFLFCQFVHKSRKFDFTQSRHSKSVFLQISRKILILGQMLLHNSNINVILAVILVHSKVLYDLPGPRQKITAWCKSTKRAWLKNGRSCPNQNCRQVEYDS